MIIRKGGRRRQAVADASGRVRQRQDREQQFARRGLRGLQYIHRHVEAAAAVGAGARPHRQFGHGRAAGGSGFTDLAFGHAVADADVHDGEQAQQARIGPRLFHPE